jgi:hypothetical protein
LQISYICVLWFAPPVSARYNNPALSFNQLQNKMPMSLLTKLRQSSFLDKMKGYHSMPPSG